jgi:ligand-binding sensor domain-containing protein
MKRIILITISLIVQQLGAQTITNYTTTEGLLDNFVECIDVDINDNVWLGTSIGVQMFDGSSLAVYDVANYPGMLSDNIKVITAMANGEIWIGTDYGANQLVSGVNGFMWLSYTTSNGLVSNQVKSINEDENGGIWIGTNQGVSYFDGNSWVSYSSPDLHWSGVNATAFDSNNDKWFASPLGGITHFDGTNFISYDTSNGLLSQYATSLLIDGQDNKWVGTSSGMSVLDALNSTFTHHTKMYLLPPPDTLNPVVDIEMDSYGRIWTAIYVGYLAEGGIAMWNGNQWIDFDVSDGLVGPNVKGLVIDSEDNVWVATSTGLSKISAIISAVSSTKTPVFNLFPNPSNNVLRLNNGTQDIQQVKIYNNLGVLVYISDNKSKEYRIDVSSFSQGLYYVNIHSANTIICKKIVVN